jgi:hypothetical protein
MKRLQACRDVACMLLGGRKRDDRHAGRPSSREYERCRDGRQRDAVASSALQMKRRVRIQYKCLVPIHVFPEMKQCRLIFPKQNYNVLSLSSYTHISVKDLYTYFQDRSVYFSAAKYVDRSWE